MTLRHNNQQESALKANIKENLIALKSTFGFKSREIADRLGMNENYLSRIYNAKVEGSTQLLSALSLLLELETLKRTPPQKSVAEQISDMQSQIAILQSALAGKYPANLASNVNSPARQAEEGFLDSAGDKSHMHPGSGTGAVAPTKAKGGQPSDGARPKSNSRRGASPVNRNRKKK